MLRRLPSSPKSARTSRHGLTVRAGRTQTPRGGRDRGTAPRRRRGGEGIAARLEPIARQNIAGAAHARIANWRASDRGLSTETFLFDLQQDGDDGPTTVKRLVV